MGAIPAVRFLDRLCEIVGSARLVRGGGQIRYRLGARIPEAAVLPKDEEEVSGVLRLAWEEGVGVVPWGGGSHQALGHQPGRYHLALDLSQLNRVVEYEPADMTATAQAGIGIPDLQRHLGDQGQFLPLDPPLAARATLGGVLATNLSGPLRCRYGTARDLVLGIRVAQADGTITKGGAKVVKNVTGYDITKLYLGSCGTLGVILEATVRVYARPVTEQGWWLAFPELAPAQALAIRILGSPLVPNRVELLDGGAAAGCGVPDHGVVLLVSTSGVPAAVQEHAAALRRMAGEFGTVPTVVSSPERTWAALGDFPWGSVDSNGRRLRAVWRGSVLSTDCASAMQAIHRSTEPWAVTAVAASVAHGILRGEFHATTPAGIIQSLTAAREVLGGLGGFLVVWDAPPPVRDQVDPWGPVGDGLPMMRQLKAAFDEKGILNPGRYVGGI